MMVLGLDTSNYTTTAAAFDGVSGKNCSRLLDVKEGELGLRQSDALFSHVKRLPELVSQLFAELPRDEIVAIGASTRPRAVEGSYMPCFLAGAEPRNRSGCSVLRLFSPAGAHRGGLLVIRPHGSDGYAASGMAPVRRYDGAVARHARKQKRERGKNRRHAGYFCRAAHRPDRKHAWPSLSVWKRNRPPQPGIGLP